MGMVVVRQRVAGLSRFSASAEGVPAGGRLEQDGCSLHGLLVLRGRVPPPLTPPHKGEGEWRASRLAAHEIDEAQTPAPPTPLWGSVGRARQAARPGRVRGGGNALHHDNQCRKGNLPGRGNHPGRNTQGGPRPRHPAHPRTRMAAVYP
jgi:hypothetical protein